MQLSSPVPVRHNRLRLPQGNLFWHEAGRGQAIVFLHGTWCDSSQWLPLFQHLASDYHCIAPDLLGFGESSAAQLPPSIALNAEGLEALFTSLRVEKVTLVAHSIGAWVALAFAQRYPEQVKALLVIEPEGFAPKALQGRWRLDRWLIAPWSPLAWGLSVLIPILQRAGNAQWLQSLRQRRKRLKSAPAACQLLFRRRSAEISAELIAPQPRTLAIMPFITIEADHASLTAHRLTQACLQRFPQASPHILPTAPTLLGLKYEAVGDLVRDLLNKFG